LEQIENQITVGCGTAQIAQNAFDQGCLHRMSLNQGRQHCFPMTDQGAKGNAITGTDNPADGTPSMA
jgi:hypothetical protein